VPFAGSLEDGLDAKATIRSLSQGQNHVFVKMRCARDELRETQEDYDVVCWVFDLDEEAYPQWSHYMGYETDLCEIYYFRQFYCRTVPVGPPDAGIERHVLGGVVSFIPSAFTAKEADQWLHDGNLPHVPTDESADWLPENLWLSGALPVRTRCCALLMTAIHFARRDVTCVLPNDFRLPSAIYAAAREKGIEIRTLPLSSMSQEVLARVRQVHSVPRVGLSPDTPPQPHVAATLGESPDAYGGARAIVHV